ncbi:MAG: penicillin-binding transpeptidase domain-containing protein [bacterium]|nr:penicillin-binding transpeptidase domain-containing protein [bacterium]
MLKKDHKIRIFLFTIILIISFMGLIIRLYYIQISQNGKMKGLPIINHMKREEVEVERGTIYDRKGRTLAVSIEVKSLYANPLHVEDVEYTASKLSPILDMKKEDIISKLNKDCCFVWLKRKLPKKEAMAIERLDLPGIHFIEEYKRFYPKGRLASNILGFAGMDNRGLEGIELSFDEYLKSKGESFQFIMDGTGKVIYNDIPKTKGYEIVLTIDEVIQHIAESELEKVCTRYEAKNGIVLVMDPKTGEMLAMAVYPNFNPNNFSRYSQSRFRNRAISDTFEPGSTFKIITGAAALQEGVVKSKDTFYCDGNIKISKHKTSCIVKHKDLTFSEIIEKSCNVGAIKTALRLKPNTFYGYIKRFGFGNLTGIDLPGEGKGILRKPGKWSRLSIPSLAIGQELSVSALQLITAITPFANEGRLIKPLIVKYIRDSDGNIIKRFNPTCVRQVISPEVALEITRILEKAVRYGTGKNAYIPGLRVAGKTGTAQKAVGGKYSEFISLFVGYLPADNPKVIILVVVDEPKGEHLGGVVASPVFKKIAERISAYLGIFSQSNFQPSPSKEPLQTSYRRTHPINNKLSIPDLQGTTMREAYRILSRHRVKMEFIGSGIAVSQFPIGGEKIRPNTKVKVFFKPPN